MLRLVIFSACIFACIDTNPNHPRVMQEILIRHFCRGNAKFMHSRSHGDPQRAVCGDGVLSRDWSGICCLHKLVYSISWPMCRINFRIQYLPPTVSSATLNGNSIHAEVDSSTLPRDLGSLDLSYNKIFGLFDLARLPPRLSRLDLRSNMITSIGTLCYLPRTIEFIHASGNPINSQTIYYDELPQSIKGIEFDETCVNHIEPFDQAKVRPDILQRGASLYKYDDSEP